MKNYVIIPQPLQIEIQSQGTLSIVGKTHDRVIFMAVGLKFRSNEKWMEFANSPIIFKNLDTRGLIDGDAIIFEYSIEGNIRNTQKLLKSVRNKIMKAIIESAINSAPDWYQPDCSGDELCRLEDKWYEEYIAPYAGKGRI
ncbi:MAG: hypothetical protein EXS50_01890 [Candidatus Taylorbacteria bacterium]|nr:hypothetical protein [Candidatus Taylorbacteria bacterium]